MPPAPAPPATRPASRRLAFVQHPFSFPATSIAEAASGICELVWVVDSTLAEMAPMLPLLHRLGRVVDVAKMSDSDAASAIAETVPDGILTLSDTYLCWTARVAALLGLPFSTAETAERLTDKHTQRRALAEGGLAVPGFWVVPPVGDARGWATLAGEVSFPAVLKPRHGEGSRHTSAVLSFEELRSGALEIAKEDDRPERELVVEEYLRDAPIDPASPFAGYVSVESIVSRRRVSHMAVTGRFPPAEPFRETGFFIPSALEEAERDQVLSVAEAAVRALDIELGCLHTEIKLTPDGPVVIEVNGRIGGRTSEMLAVASGVGLLPIALRLALGEDVGFEAMPVCDKVGYLFYVQAPAGLHRVCSVDGLDQLRGDPRVRQIILNRGPGQAIDWRDGNHGHVFSVFGAAPDHESVGQLADQIGRQVVVKGE